MKYGKLMLCTNHSSFSPLHSFFSALSLLYTSYHRLLSLLNQVLEIVVLVLLEGREDEIEDNFPVVLCPLPSLLLFLLVISLWTLEPLYNALQMNDTLHYTVSLA